MHARLHETVKSLARPRVCGFTGARPLLATLCPSVLCVVLATACTSLPREDAPLVPYADAVPPGFPNTVRWTGEPTRREFKLQLASVGDRIQKAANGSPVDFLALSGGGVGGSFGAGVLVGWSRLGTRPQFHIVTGVSAGALIAPLAFLGPGWDRQLTEAFSGTAAVALLQSHWLGALFGASVFQGGPLRELVDRFVTDDLLQAVAAETEKGRLLLVATTDLDRQRIVIWNMGVIAAHGGEDARKLFRDVLIASASVPGVFPPVLIRVEASGNTFEEMHVDGSTTAPLLVATGIVAILPDELEPLRGGNMYVVVNGKLRAVEETTPVNTVSILKRSVVAALESNTRHAVELAYSFAQRNEMKLKVTEIPNNYVFRGLLDLGPSTMKALFEYGVRCATEGRLWADPLDVLDDVARPSTASPDGAAQCPAPIASGPKAQVEQAR